MEGTAATAAAASSPQGLPSRSRRTPRAPETRQGLCHSGSRHPGQAGQLLWQQLQPEGPPSLVAPPPGSQVLAGPAPGTAHAPSPQQGQTWSPGIHDWRRGAAPPQEPERTGETLVLVSLASCLQPLPGDTDPPTLGEQRPAPITGEMKALAHPPQPGPGTRARTRAHTHTHTHRNMHTRAHMHTHTGTQGHACSAMHPAAKQPPGAVRAPAAGRGLPGAEGALGLQPRSRLQVSPGLCLPALRAPDPESPPSRPRPPPGSAGPPARGRPPPAHVCGLSSSAGGRCLPGAALLLIAGKVRGRSSWDRRARGPGPGRAEGAGEGREVWWSCGCVASVSSPPGAALGQARSIPGLGPIATQMGGPSREDPGALRVAAWCPCPAKAGSPRPCRPPAGGAPLCLPATPAPAPRAGLGPGDPAGGWAEASVQRSSSSPGHGNGATTQPLAPGCWGPGQTHSLRQPFGGLSDGGRAGPQRPALPSRRPERGAAEGAPHPPSCPSPRPAARAPCRHRDSPSLDARTPRHPDTDGADDGRAGRTRNLEWKQP